MKLIFSRRTITIAVFAAITLSVSSQERIEFLNPQLNTVKDSLSCKYIRTVWPQEDSSYKVEVKYKTGEVMMAGVYSNPELTVENGNFQFFYANGFVESEGRFRNGIKVGTWKRWNYDGRQKPERFYPDENFKRSNRTTAPAKFPGGINSLHQLVNDSLIYPEEAMRRKIQGTVYVTFMIDEAGDVRQAEISGSVHYLLDEEALRFVSNMPSWSPATRYGVPIDSSFIMPITFDIQSEKATFVPGSSKAEEPFKTKAGQIAAQK
ncbi:MAG: TonB family protein [Crocinitomicaceae bacterium]|nr:TonB family protein [Crocinitomicaceae bacterium]